MMMSWYSDLKIILPSLFLVHLLLRGQVTQAPVLYSLPRSFHLPFQNLIT